MSFMGVKDKKTKYKCKSFRNLLIMKNIVIIISLDFGHDL